MISDETVTRFTEEILKIKICLGIIASDHDKINANFSEIAKLFLNYKRVNRNNKFQLIFMLIGAATLMISIQNQKNKIEDLTYEIEDLKRTKGE